MYWNDNASQSHSLTPHSPLLDTPAPSHSLTHPLHCLPCATTQNYMCLPDPTFVPLNFCRGCSLSPDILTFPYHPALSPATLIVPRFCCDTGCSVKPSPHPPSRCCLSLLGSSNSSPALTIQRLHVTRQPGSHWRTETASHHLAFPCIWHCAWPLDEKKALLLSQPLLRSVSKGWQHLSQKKERAAEPMEDEEEALLWDPRHSPLGRGRCTRSHEFLTGEAEDGQSGK